jgi:hypothetical protein
MPPPYQDLLNHPMLHLPVSPNGKGYKITIRELLIKFKDELSKLDNGPLNIVELQHITGFYVKEVQQRFTDGLLETIDLYYNGLPADAFTKLSDTLDNDLKDFREVLKIRQYETDQSFFRMRIYRGNTPLEMKAMFHIPFEKRGLVNTQRYSIPGFPCLYLGRTVYGCWEEMNRPDINDFQVVRLKNILPIKYLDLTRPKYSDNLMTRDIYHYLMTWPLIACCSVKVSNYVDPFKPEYIIPQLLLQWVRKNQDLDAIRFNSTHIDFHKTGSVGDFSNLVLPVKSNKDSGYCHSLTEIFEMTSSISWQLHEHALGGATFIRGSWNETREIDKRIEKLELIPGRLLPYNFSVLGNLEDYLDGMGSTGVAALNDPVENT